MRKRIFVVSLCAAMLAVGAVAAQPPGGGRGGQRGGFGGAGGAGGPGGRQGFPMPRFALIDALDADQDGKLSAEEIENAVAALKSLDKDNDGTLTREEIGWPPMMGRGFGGPGGGFGGPGGPGGGFGGPGGPGGGFGGPGGGPGGPGFGGPEGGMDIVERIMSHDADNDGKVTREELPEFLQRMLDRADTNNDGALEKSEVEAIQAAFGRGGGMGRGGPGGRGGGRGNAPERPRRPASEEDAPN